MSLQDAVFLISGNAENDFETIIKFIADENWKPDQKFINYDLKTSPDIWMKDLLENEINSVIFNQYLSNFKTEENIRLFLSFSVTNSRFPIYIVEKFSNNRISSIIFKSCECIGCSVSYQIIGDFRILRVEIKQHDMLKNFDRAYQDRLGFSPHHIDITNLVSRAQDAIDSGVGFSLVRFNHCEPRIMGYGRFFYDHDLNVTFNIQWGHDNVSATDRLQLAAMMKTSLLQADVVGVPKFKSNIATKLHILENSFFTLSASEGLIGHNTNFCDVNIHLQLGLSEAIYSLISSSPEVHLITGRKISEKLSIRTGKKNINELIIPSESKFSKNQQNDGHYKKYFQEISNHISATCRPKSLWLVGAGILGKHYCSLIKMNGGVALDIGSLFDAWAGLSTRGAGFPESLRL